VRISLRASSYLRSTGMGCQNRKWRSPKLHHSAETGEFHGSYRSEVRGVAADSREAR
jgi:hypothetical protein